MISEERLIKFIKDQLSPDEKEEVMDWIEMNVDNRRRYSALKAELTVSEFNKPHLDENRVYDEIRAKTRKKSRYVYRISGVAAAILVLISAWFFWGQTTSYEDRGPVAGQNKEGMASTAYGENKEITLPDGSLAMLNAGSELTWSPVFEDSLREVFLSGEAWFEVVRDTTRPFIVRAGDMNVRVLGTTFNVRAYSGDPHPRTTLVSGSVVLEGENVETVKLAPLQTGLLDRAHARFDVRDVAEDEAVPWIEGKMVFKDTPLQRVMEDLERKYNVDMEAESDEMKDFLFTGTFDRFSMDEVLRVLEISSGIRFREKQGKIILY